MSGFPIIDLIAGMIFVYFLLSIISSSVVEMILTGLKARSKLLAQWLCKIFDEQVTVGNTTKPLGQAIMDHCTVTGLSEKGKSPSYIDAKNFTAALLEKLTFDPNNPNSIANDLNTFINKIEQTNSLSLELKRVLLTYAYEARDTYKQSSNKVTSDVNIFRSKIENWYDTSMERLGGDLKRKYSRPFTLIVAALVVILMNADSISIARYFYRNPAVTTQVANAAAKVAEDSIYSQRITAIQNATDTTAEQFQKTMQTGIDNINQAKAALEEDLPFGWDAAYFRTITHNNLGNGVLIFLSKITGLVATVIAIMMGAPFWFDLLNKVSNMRGTGNKPVSTATTGNDATDTTPQQPVTITVNSNKEEEAVG